MSDNTTYYKVLTVEGESCHGGNYTWPLPRDGPPGAWTPRVTDLAPCERGYHIVTLDQLPQWLKTPAVWTVEPRGRIIHDKDKSVCESARLIERVGQWNPRTIRLLTAAWVEHLLETGAYDWTTPKNRRKLTELVAVTRGYADKDGTTLVQVEAARRAVRSSLPSASASASLSLASASSLSSLSSLSSSSSSWLRDRYRELLTAPGDWSHVDWTEW